MGNFRLSTSELRLVLQQCKQWMLLSWRPDAWTQACIRVQRDSTAQHRVGFIAARGLNPLTGDRASVVQKIRCRYLIKLRLVVIQIS